jgi:hypothetical protein
MNIMDANLSSVLTVLIQTLGTAFGLYLTYRATIRNVASKSQVEEVHKTVNGNFTRERDRAEKYAAKLRDIGIDPDSE